MAEGYSVRVHLAPAPVLTRVVTVGRVLRGPPLEWMEREVSVTRFLADHGLPVAPPWEQPGPFAFDGLEVSLWEMQHRVEGQVSQQDFGAMLGVLHEGLDAYPDTLPRLVGPLTDIETATTVSADATLHAAAAVVVPRALDLPTRALHGDAHLGNLMLTSSGPVWIDFEDVCSGPAEWDLASLTLGEEAVRGYPGVVDRERLELCRALRKLQVYAALLTDDLQDADLRGRLKADLDAVVAAPTVVVER